MCGIVGIVGENVADQGSALERMALALRHRGPDGTGLQIGRHALLGHTRLAIVDLVGGSQPMASECKSIQVVFNGEIYGYRDIKSRLGDYRFRTTSDTEVLLALYLKHNSRMLDHLPGMFAFAIWDERTRSLLCARDRFGEKPLYYARGKGGMFIFGSEIKAIIASGLVEPVLRLPSIAHYLSRLYVHPCQTIYENIHVLPPAHALRFHDGQLAVWKYWEMPSQQSSISTDEAIEGFDYLLHQAVKRQLVADVPIGAFLSGGLDSSTIVAAAVTVNPRIQTLSFDFTGTHSELPFARAVARHLGTEHTVLTASECDIADTVLRMQDVYDEPFGDSSNIPTYLLAQRARRHVKVALCGDGADELLGGYDSYKRLIRMKTGSAGLFRRNAILALGRIAGRMHFRSAAPFQKWSLGLQHTLTPRSLLRYYQEATRWFAPSEVVALGLTGKQSETNGHLAESDPGKTIGDVMRWDLAQYMPGDILVKIDRAAMAHGLELRAPFLDVDLASFCLSLPDRLKVTAHEDKIVLRRAFSHQLPKRIRNRRKQGFGAPVSEWLARPEMKALVDEYLNNKRRKIYDLMPHREVARYGAAGNYKTWILLILSTWLESHEFSMPKNLDSGAVVAAMES